MEKFTEEEVKHGREFAEFYFDLIENHNETFPYYLSENAVLDWFGQTVRGVKKIGLFLKNNVASTKHNFPNIEMCSNIGYRDTHVIKLPPPREQSSFTTLHLTASEEKTPPAMLSPSSSKKREKGQGDGLHNCNDESPVKRTRLIRDIVDPEPETPLKIQNITSQGHIEFRRRSTKKYQRETKWSRPCKFQVAFSKTSSGYVIHLMIYEGNMKCRRNLMKDFDAVESGD